MLASLRFRAIDSYSPNSENSFRTELPALSRSRCGARACAFAASCALLRAIALLAIGARRGVRLVVRLARICRNPDTRRDRGRRSRLTSSIMMA